MITGNSLVDGILRGMVWAVVNSLLSILDLVYDFTKTLLSLDYLNLSDDIWMWFWLLTTAFTGFFVIFRIGKNFALDAAEISDDKEMRINASRLITRLIALELVILLAQPVLSGLSWVSSSLIENINVFTGTQETTLSAVIIQANGVDIDDSGEWTVEINAKDSDGNYVYFNNITDMLLLVVIVFIGSYQMFFIIFGIGDRLVAMLVKILLAPWCFSSLVEQSPQNFATWCRLFLADFFGNFVVCFMLVTGCSVVMGANLDAIVKCVLLIGVLIGIQSAPQTAAHLIGADIGMSQGMRSLQTLMGVGSALGGVASLAGGLAATAGSWGVYGAGRLLGGMSRHDQQLYSAHDGSAQSNSSSGGGSGGGTTGDGSDGSGGSPTPTAGGAFGNDSNTGESSSNDGGYDAGGGSNTNALGDGDYNTNNTSSGDSGQAFIKPDFANLLHRPKSRTAYDNTFAHRAASHQYQNKFTRALGTFATNRMSSLYERSARRLNTKEERKYGGYKKDAGRRATRNVQETRS